MRREHRNQRCGLEARIQKQLQATGSGRLEEVLLRLLETQEEQDRWRNSSPGKLSAAHALEILGLKAGATEQEIRAIEDRSTNYWLLEYLSRYKRDTPLQAVVLDGKGNVELADYYLRAKVAATIKATPGETVPVQIESIDPAKGDVRFRTI